jgi:hypothetical protein
MIDLVAKTIIHVAYGHLTTRVFPLLADSGLSEPVLSIVY